MHKSMVAGLCAALWGSTAAPKTLWLRAKSQTAQPKFSASSAWRDFALARLLVLALQPLYLAALIVTDTIAPASPRAEVMKPSMQLNVIFLILDCRRDNLASP